jgi:hypothetical protein
MKLVVTRSVWTIVAAAVAACGVAAGGVAACRAAAPGPQPPASDVASARPGPALERALRLDAARSLGCPAGAIELAAIAWDGAQGRYRASGCGWVVTYVVACEADDRCGFVAAESETR